MQDGVISPQDRGRPVAVALSEEPIPELGVSPAELERRLRANTYEWLPRQFDEEVGAFYGHYNPVVQSFEAPQTANLIAPWQLLAAYDRYHDEELLNRARRAAEWFYGHYVVTHPMSVVIGGVRDALRPEELWLKYAAEFVILNVGLYRRTDEAQYLERAIQSGQFLIQSQRHGFAPRYDERVRAWEADGWRSFGRVIEAFLELRVATEDPLWQEHALRWGEFARSIQAPDGCFYLIDDDYFNSDLAADELRALLFLAEQTGHGAYLDSARRFADWLVACQRANGSWPLTVDRDGNVVVSTVGPGDCPNIAVALLHLYEVTAEAKYRQAAMLAYRYAVSSQILPDSGQLYADDPRVQWGYWSWDPRYDYTVSPDQSTHHVRGLYFLLDMQLHSKVEEPSIMDV